MNEDGDVVLCRLPGVNTAGAGEIEWGWIGKKAYEYKFKHRSEVKEEEWVMAVQWLAMARRYMMDNCILKNGTGKWRGGEVDEMLAECMEIQKSAAHSWKQWRTTVMWTGLSEAGTLEKI